MSSEEKTNHLQGLLSSLWIAPAFGALSMLALLVWGVISAQPLVVMMAVSVTVLSVVGWAMTRDYVGHQLTNSR